MRSIWLCALVLTLTEFPEISSVTVSVDGVAVDAEGVPADGRVALTRPAANPETPEAVAGGTELYFVYPGADRYLVPVTRATAADEREPGAAMEAFLAGPREGSGLEPVLPDDVGIHSTRVEDGLATVDFDYHLVYAYRLSKANAMFVRRAVMATLTGLPGIDAGLIEIREELGHELLDAGASRAFAVADHQIAHVYVRDAERVAEAMASGVGRNACTWSRRKLLRFSQRARLSMSSSRVPGWAAMKYGIRYCSLPACLENFSNSALKRS